MHPIEKITKLIQRYDKEKSSLDTESLQDIRDDLSTALFNCADFMAGIRRDSESAQFNHKLCSAKYEQELTGKLDPRTSKKYTREGMKAAILLHCEDLYKDVLEANRKYYKVKIVEDSIKQILNSISSRIHNAR